MYGIICPETIDATVQSFCDSINPKAEPRYVPLQPLHGCTPQECFINVRNRVESEGGTIVYGWAIWRNPLFIEAEHHAVYRPQDSEELVDITPQRDGGTRTLFLPDEKANYDFESDTAKNNIRLPLVKDARVNELCDLYGFKNDIENAARVGRKVQLEGESLAYWKAVVGRILLLESSFLNEQTLRGHGGGKTGRNDPCPCGSGRKFKKCCLK